jgi:N-acetyl-anhydromuramyl-L-alanine amidase AmpD
MANRYRPHVSIRRNSPNQSSRGGRRPVLIVVHSTESDQAMGNSRDLAAVADFLSRTSVQASAHVITDGDGHSCRLVPDSAKAWHCANFNSISLGIEQIGRAASEHWHRDEYRETARWIAHWSKAYGIPLRHGAVRGLSVVRTGIVRHKDLGINGGGHVDPGPNYDLSEVISLAKFYKARI